MGIMIIGEPDNAPFPAQFAVPLVYSKDAWEDDWDYEPELQLVSFGVRASSSQASSCEVMRRFGNVKQTFDSDFSDRSPWDLDGSWIKVTMVGEEGETTQFVGQIDAQAESVSGNDTTATGKQHWVAYGGLRTLQKITISTSVFSQPKDGNPVNLSIVEWIPPMNERDRRGLVVGNRSTDNVGNNNTFVYGGKEVWSHLQYAKYVLEEFVRQTTGPNWTLTGQTDILDQLKTSIRFSETITAAEMFRHLIPIRYGVDYFVKPTDDGFEIVVFSLASSDESVVDVTMPANPNTVEIQRSTEKDLTEVQIVETDERRYDKVQIVGKRIIVCGTLRGPNSIGGNSLVKKWSDAIEAEYTLPNGGDGDPGKYDTIRKREKYRDVYQRLGAPLDWDLDGGTWAVMLDDDGNITTGDFQTSIRETLSWIPLKEGFDYTTDPATDNTVGSADTPDIKPPLAWLYDANPTEGDPGYVLAHQAGIHVSKPFQDWGIVLDASPNHRLALNHWNDDQLASTSDPEGPRYDYESVVATIAIESDHRVRIVYDVPDDIKAGDGSVMTVLDEGAEMWVLLSGTIVDADTSGTLVPAGDDIRILRDDRDRLKLVLAGAMARYVNERVRAALTFRQFQPWADLVGNVLTVVQQGDDRQNIGAPITSIEWLNTESPTMIVKTGYA